MPNVDQLHRLRSLHLFAGAGGGILSDLILGHRPICAVEIDPYCAQVLQARQKDGIIPWFPIWDDVKTFDGKPWRGIADIVAGGFPCTDISCAGKGAGITGKNSGLWKEMARIIGEVRPRYVFVENSPMLLVRGIGVVLGDLAEMGYDTKHGVVAACELGAWHERERLWIAADSHGWRHEQQESAGQFRDNKERNCSAHSKKRTAEHGTIRAGLEITSYANVIGAQAPSQERRLKAHDVSASLLNASDLDDQRELQSKGRIANQRRRTRNGTSKDDANSSGKSKRKQAIQADSITRGGNARQEPGCGDWWAAEPAVVRMVYGIPYGVDRIRALGNAQVPIVAATAWNILNGDL